MEKERSESIIEQLGLLKIRGRVFGQNGETLSGGEKQRISLDRFLLKSNFDFFVLDEPFTAMDAILEAECTALLSQKISRKPGMIITHKIHLAETLASKIVYISNGRVEASGSAKELVAGCASYRSLRDTYFANVLKDSDRVAPT
ncbi:MAG: ATP-binding cassette domain-containing protein [Spirochaetaceae bacterium]|nr:ATP-binding cassette domain-containing protein [Spirochaetaceae bacterium]